MRAPGGACLHRIESPFDRATSFDTVLPASHDSRRSSNDGVIDARACSINCASFMPDDPSSKTVRLITHSTRGESLRFERWGRTREASCQMRRYERGTWPSEHNLCCWFRWSAFRLESLTTTPRAPSPTERIIGVFQMGPY